MHVAVDAANLPRDRRGIGRYVRAMLSRWLNAPDRIRLTLLVPDLFLAAARRRLEQTLQRGDIQVRRRSSVRALQPDLVWYPWNGMTWTSTIPSVATVHDVWPFVSPAADAGIRRREQTAYLTMAAQSRAIIANSNFTKNEIVKYLPIVPQRVHVIHMGVDRPGKSAPVLLEGAQRYVLFVGEDERRKDLDTLRSAMELLPKSLQASTGLVVAGKARSQTQVGQITEASDTAQGTVSLGFATTPSVPTLVTGEISDALLNRLYANAAVFAFPSTYEGFGLPVLEAMAHGIPVIAANAASIPEVGGNAALYFPALDPNALATTLERVLSDTALATALRATGLARSFELSWDRCADATLSFFADLLQANC